MENKYKRLFKNTLWTLGGNTGSKLLAFILLPYYTRWLGTDGYGMSDLITTYSSLMLGLITLCAADGIFVFTKNKKKEESSIYFTTISLFTLGLFFLWAIGCCIVKSIYAESSSFFIDHLWLILLMVLSLFIQNYTQQYVISLDKMKVYSLTGMVLCITTFILSFLLIPEYGVVGYVYSIIIANLITSVYSVLASSSYRFFKPSSFDFQIIRPFLIYTVPLIPNSIMWWIVNALNRPLMEQHLGLSQIGIYAVANKFPGIITMVFGLFAVSWNISLFEEYDKPAYSVFYTKTFKTLFLSMFVCCFALMCFSKTIIGIFAAPEFFSAWQFTVLLAIGSFLSCFSTFFGTIFSVVKQSKYLLYSSIWGAVVSLLLNFILIPLWGLYGACISVCVSFLAMALSRYIYSKKYVEASLSLDLFVYILSMAILAFGLLDFMNALFSVILVILSLSIVLLYNHRTLTSLVVAVRKKCN